MRSFNSGSSSGSGFRGNFRGPRYRQETPDAHRINGRITAREVRVVTEAGEQLGVLAIRDALLAAEKYELDLVEVAPNANPPVCRIMDYGKFKYKEQKKEAESRKNRTENVLKEIRIRYRTDTGDLETKLKQAREFISEGDKVKFSMRFKGREAMYMNLGSEKFDEIVSRLSDIASVDERSPLSGRQIHIVFAPNKGATVAAKSPGKPATPIKTKTEAAPLTQSIQIPSAVKSDSKA